jgi:small subunit ribosomal protein S16
MLAIRMQRTGRKGHAMFRVVVQDSRRTPSSGRIVAQIGHYDPHTKAAVIVKDKADFYLQNGAQPSDRVIRLFETEGVKLPDWVAKPSQKTGAIRHQDKLRKNRPVEEAPAEEPVAEVADAPAETPDEAPAE